MVKNSVLVSVLLVSLVAGLGLGYGLANPTQYEQRIAGLENEIAELESQVSSFLEQIEAKDHQILSLVTQLSGLAQQIEMRNREMETVFLGVYFSPKGGCEDQVLYWISRANVSIHVLIYSFTLDPIGDALLEAHNRNVEVQVVFEVGQITEASEYQKLRAAGIPVRNDTNSRDMHDKVMIVDGTIVLTGSFNWSSRGENENNENLIVMNSTYVAAIYEDEFQKIWISSV